MFQERQKYFVADSCINSYCRECKTDEQKDL